MSQSTKAISLYRGLLRAGKLAVGDNKRGIGATKAKVREGFEQTRNLEDKGDILNQLEKGHKTLKFLKVAKDPTSEEHRIVKSLCIMHQYQQNYRMRPTLFKRKASPEMKKAYEENSEYYERTIRLLNETAGLALR